MLAGQLSKGLLIRKSIKFSSLRERQATFSRWFYPDKRLTVWQATSVFNHLQGVNIIITSYDDQDEIQNILDKHKIEVVLSTISPANSEAFDAQVRLIRACDKSESVKRFAPSEYLIDYERDEE